MGGAPTQRKHTGQSDVRYPTPDPFSAQNHQCVDLFVNCFVTFWGHELLWAGGVCCLGEVPGPALRICL